MNFGIGYDFFSVFLRSDDYRIVSKIAYAALLICPFIFYYVKKYSAMLIIYMSAAFISVKLMSLYIMWGKLRRRPASAYGKFTHKRRSTIQGF